MFSVREIFTWLIWIAFQVIESFSFWFDSKNFYSLDLHSQSFPVAIVLLSSFHRIVVRCKELSINSDNNRRIVFSLLLGLLWCYSLLTNIRSTGLKIYTIQLVESNGVEKMNSVAVRSTKMAQSQNAEQWNADLHYLINPYNHSLCTI